MIRCLGAANSPFHLAAGLIDPNEGSEKARTFANQALELDPRSAVAHSVLCAINETHDWNWSAAHYEVEKLDEIHAGASSLINCADRLALIEGRFDEAYRRVTQAIASDPLTPFHWVLLSWTQLARDRPVDAESAVRKALAIDPVYLSAHFQLAITLIAQGKAAAALEEMKKESPEGGQLAGMAIAYYALNQRAESDDALKRFEKAAPNESYALAQVYAYRGDRDTAFHLLDKAFEQRDSFLYFIKADYTMRALHDDARYRQFLRRMNLQD